MGKPDSRETTIIALLEARGHIDIALAALGYERPVLTGSMGERIKTLRTQLRMSLDDVARRAGITKSHVWELEQGRSSNPTIGTVSAIASALGVLFQDLAFEDNDA